eukprot:SAG31_NODE_36748_length_310_cov_1.478673_1_plen_25_part_10
MDGALDAPQDLRGPPLIARLAIFFM